MVRGTLATTVLLHNYDSSCVSAETSPVRRCNAAVARVHAARRRLPRKPPRRGRGRSSIRPPDRAARRHPPGGAGRAALVGNRAGAGGRFCPDLGLSQLFLAGAAAAAGHLGRAVAGDDRHPHPAVAVQAQHPDDDHHVRRCAGHRRRYLLVSADDHPRSRLEGRPRRAAGDPSAGAAVAARAIPGAAQPRGRRSDAVLRRPGGALLRGADRPRRRIPSKQIRFQVRALGGGRGRRSIDPRRRAGSRCGGAGAAEPRRGPTLRAGRQAAAHRHGVRRIRASTSP